MKRKYAKIMFLSMTLLTSSITTAYATIPEDEKKEETQKVTEDAHLPLMIINGTNKSEHFFISSESLTNKEIKITAPNGFTVSPSVIPANSGKQKVTVTLNSSKILTEGKIVLRNGDYRSYLKVKTSQNRPFTKVEMIPNSTKRSIPVPKDTPLNLE